MSDVKINPKEHTVTGVRSLRSAGHSLTLTIPPAVLDSIEADEGDDIELVADMDEGKITCRKVGDETEGVEDGEEGSDSGGNCSGPGG